MIRRLAILALLLPVPAAALELGFPVACTPGTDCWVIHYVDHDPGPGVSDSYCGPMTYDGHDGTDIGLRDGAAMRAGMAVVAAAPGTVKAIRDGVPDIAVEVGGKEAVKGIDCGNGVLLEHADGWETQYCHLREGSVSVRQGQEVAVGERLGLVGLSGMTSFPHLHLAVRKDGVTLDPFHASMVRDACTVRHQPLWAEPVARALAYQPLALPILGVSDGPVGAEVWDGRAGTAPLTTAAPALVVFMGGYALRKDDRIELMLTAPDGTPIVQHPQFQQRDQARNMYFAGRKRPPEGWQAGMWTARVAVTREGETWTQDRTFELAPAQ